MIIMTRFQRVDNDNLEIKNVPALCAVSQSQYKYQVFKCSFIAATSNQIQYVFITCIKMVQHHLGRPPSEKY